ncbi:hypothetical protein [Streptomyces goshikiensis]|uniref:hypothetical protein n=1 Tax=Streptomyces goshikiensis TaxID=1942 RepID=UPI0036B406BA
MGFYALAVLALGAAAIAVFLRFEPARPFAALIALLAVMLAGFQRTEAKARETDYRVLRERGAVVDAAVTEQVATPDGSVIAATDTWSARVLLPDGSTEHLDTFG